VYHNTSAFAARKIIEQNKFALTLSLGTEIEMSEKHTKKQKFYFLSVSRHKLGFRKTGWVFLILDGKKLSHKYVGDPMEYWSHEWRNPKDRPQDLAFTESEDRIWSKDPYIEPARDYIKEIHILDRADDNQDKLLTLLKKYDIPTFILRAVRPLPLGGGYKAPSKLTYLQ
jgi:hypothetical protein